MACPPGHEPLTTDAPGGIAPLGIRGVPPFVFSNGIERREGRQSHFLSTRRRIRSNGQYARGVPTAIPVRERGWWLDQGVEL